jgi:hypothetical protein
VTAPGVWTQYSNIEPLLGQLPGWVPEQDKFRVASYLKYDQIYWSSEEGFEQILRGDNENPIFLPTARTLVNTLHRYTAPGFTFRMEGSTGDVKVCTMAFNSLFRREQFYSKFTGFTLDGGKLGDALIHLVADPSKPVGKRLRITVVDPSAFFPVYDLEDPEKLIKIHLAEQVQRGNDTLVSRLTYEKVFGDDGSTLGIMRSHALFKTEKWWELTQAEEVILAPEMLPPEIQAFPVYHYKNGDPTRPFGSSSMRGLETVFAGISQAISDEDLTLAMEGLGVYATDGGPPVDENNNEVDVILGPGRFISHANGLKRINGVGSVTPYGEHIERLQDAAYTSVGASDVALGKDTTAEAGIALQIRLGPIMATTGRNDQELVDLFTQFFYDLQFWLAVYEELPLLNGSGAEALPKVTVLPVIGPKMPVNLTEVINQIVALRNCVPPVVSLRTSHALLRAAGLAIPEDELVILANEAAGVLDPLGEPSPTEDTAGEDRAEEELGV